MAFAQTVTSIINWCRASPTGPSRQSGRQEEFAVCAFSPSGPRRRVNLLITVLALLSLPRWLVCDPRRAPRTSRLLGARPGPAPCSPRRPPGQSRSAGVPRPPRASPTGGVCPENAHVDVAQSASGGRGFADGGGWRPGPPGDAYRAHRERWRDRPTRSPNDRTRTHRCTGRLARAPRRAPCLRHAPRPRARTRGRTRRRARTRRRTRGRPDGASDAQRGASRGRGAARCAPQWSQTPATRRSSGRPRRRGAVAPRGHQPPPAGAAPQAALGSGRVGRAPKCRARPASSSSGTGSELRLKKETPRREAVRPPLRPRSRRWTERAREDLASRPTGSELPMETPPAAA